MNIDELSFYYYKFKFGEDNYHNLMQYKVREILLISSFYDAFILEQDGRLSEQIFGEYLQLKLTAAPRITTVQTFLDAKKKLTTYNFDLVIISSSLGKVSLSDMSKDIQQNHPELPVLILLNKKSYSSMLLREKVQTSNVEELFYWNGNSSLFLAMIKTIEDRKNVEYDTENGMVGVIMLIESSIKFYSKFLPLLYKEIMIQTQRIVASEVSDINKRLHMRARPKVILAHSFEYAKELYEKYEQNIICLISNSNFYKNGYPDPEAGIKFINTIREKNPHLPILLQSSDTSNQSKAEKMNITFLNKNSECLLHDIRAFLLDNIGLGDFIFRDPNGSEVVRAKNIYEFEDIIKNLKDESLLFHAKGNHFSAWLIAHGEIRVAQKIRPLHWYDFTDINDLRNFLIKSIHFVRKEKLKGQIIDFEPSLLAEDNVIIRLGSGSLGGKGRGIAFLNALFATIDLEKEFSEIRFKIPQTAIIGTDEFDIFLEQNDINTKIIELDDNSIKDRFLKGNLHNELKDKLIHLLNIFKKPLAIRSSGLLEDSQSQPFAGVYQTIMIPNNNANPDIRLEQLCKAIKVVFSSPFHENPRKYIESINFKLEEEKMAVIIQEVTGSELEKGLFYPHISGVAQSYNFYPTSVMKHQDGIALLAAGLGKTVVDGGRNFRFCPAHPKISLLKPINQVENNQRKLFAIDLEKQEIDFHKGEMATLKQIRISKNHTENILKNLTSVWDYQNESFIDSSYAKGPRVITFRSIVNFQSFPISKILNRILEIGKIAHGVPVEIEFALNLSSEIAQKKSEFTLLQIRPLSVQSEDIDINLDKIEKKDLILSTASGMGNGIISNIHDIVYIKKDNFDNTKTLLMMNEIQKINSKLRKSKKTYILIGPGRWGSSDRFLGIPVKWTDIDHAKIIVEVGLKDFMVEASQGSHFFHNLVAMSVGYLTVNPNLGIDTIDFTWLENHEKEEETDFFVHISSKNPFVVKMDGRNGNAVIFKTRE